MEKENSPMPTKMPCTKDWSCVNCQSSQVLVFYTVLEVRPKDGKLVV